MAGTLTDKATLATDNAFINKCRVAILARAVELTTGKEVAQSYTTLSQMHAIIVNAGADAAGMAWRVVAGDPAIGAAAPAVPSDSDTQAAVNTFLAEL